MCKKSTWLFFGHRYLFFIISITYFFIIEYAKRLYIIFMFYSEVNFVSEVIMKDIIFDIVLYELS